MKEFKMSNKNFNDVREMYNFFGVTMANKPCLLSEDEACFRLDCLHEELMELTEAFIDSDLPEIIDALIDLTVFAMGTAAIMGFDWQKHWEEVMRANNDKVPGVTKRGYKIDLKKPEGWKAPDHKKIIGWIREDLPL